MPRRSISLLRLLVVLVATIALGHGFPDAASAVWTGQDGAQSRGSVRPTCTTHAANVVPTAAAADPALPGISGSSRDTFRHCVATEDEGAVTQIIKTRPEPGADGGISNHIIEQQNGETTSVTHQVEVDGQVVHQHQTYIGKYGGQRQFPPEWSQFPDINAP